MTTIPPQQALLLKINGEELGINVTSTVGKKTKCARCWHRRADIGQDPEHPEICLRCVENLPNGKGEQRMYV